MCTTLWSDINLKLKMVTPVKRVPIHLQSAQNRLIIKNGTLVNDDGEQQVDIYIEVMLDNSATYSVFRIRILGLPDPDSETGSGSRALKKDLTC